MASDGNGPIIVWFRNDLRIADNAALSAAADTGKPVVCLWIRDFDGPDRRPGSAQAWWLYHSLNSLAGKIKNLGSVLVFRSGNAGEILASLARETSASAVFWNRRYNPAAIPDDIEIKSDLTATGTPVRSFDGQLLHEPSQFTTVGGTPFKVFTPFWRSFLQEPEPRKPYPAPVKLVDGSARISSERLQDWNLLPAKPDWAKGMAAEWTPGEHGAHERLEAFLHGAIQGYGDDRNLPYKLSTSKLSPHLALGEITPFQVWHATQAVSQQFPRDAAKFLSEVGWREFAYHLLFHFPKLATDNFNARFDAFPWGEANPEHLKAWQKGKTGYPIVDAGMRELWSTGWMHNRVRMIAASFLIKHLMIDWRTGEKWFWETLVDACPANNPASWQWVAGSGADAAPYFRIFNPVLQGEKFDPDGDYVRQFVPELKNMPAKFIHRPSDAPIAIQKQAGCIIGKDYPSPIVDHDTARARALAAFQNLKGNA